MLKSKLKSNQKAADYVTIIFNRTVWMVLPFKVLILTLTAGGGLVAYAKYHDCDPIVTKQVRAPDQIYPLFVLDSLSFIPGFTGLFVAGVFSGSLRWRMIVN